MMQLFLKNLEDILLDEFKPAIDPYPGFRLQRNHDQEYKEEIQRIFAELGGTGHLPNTCSLNWNLELERGIVQLDEQLHFNKYRRITLRSSIYQEFKGFQLAKYQQYCRKFDKECLMAGSAGELWTHARAERLFGPGEEYGDLYGKGAPAWKVRAFEDFLQDITAYKEQLPLLRLSVYDELMINKQLVKIKDILTTPTPEWKVALINFVKRKLEI
ncbi:hypothetical protein AAG747_13650 [Rapidithrix thailandica]|uniref:Uncharacterized protein n=1 Tax=Rapidithrix thailandica TaxID=413964 RepID=A0AAW9S632_9BACT